MFCSKCGKEIADEAVICPNCGCSTNNQYSKPEVVESEEDKASGGLLALSIILPIVGVVLGIINLCKKKTKSGAAYLIAGVSAWVLFALLFSGL